MRDRAAADRQQILSVLHLSASDCDQMSVFALLLQSIAVPLVLPRSCAPFLLSPSVALSHSYLNHMFGKWRAACI